VSSGRCPNAMSHGWWRHWPRWPSRIRHWFCPCLKHGLWRLVWVPKLILVTCARSIILRIVVLVLADWSLTRCTQVFATKLFGDSNDMRRSDVPLMCPLWCNADTLSIVETTREACRLPRHWCSRPLVETFIQLIDERRLLLVLPRHRLRTYGRWAFSVAGPSAWNSLPDNLKRFDR